MFVPPVPSACESQWASSLSASTGAPPSHSTTLFLRTLVLHGRAIAHSGAGQLLSLCCQHLTAGCSCRYPWLMAASSNGESSGSGVLNLNVVCFTY